jgi:hypothetical protein
MQGTMNIAVISVNSSVIDQVTYLGSRVDFLGAAHKAKLTIRFVSGKNYEILGSAASEVFASLALAVSNNDSIGQWFNREVKNNYELELVGA